MSLKPLGDFYSYTTTFTIIEEKDLEDLWSYAIFRLNLEQSASAYDRFARLYNFLNDKKHLLLRESPLTISLKESTDQYFISLETQISSILKECTQKLQHFHHAYTYDHNSLEYTINKKDTMKLQTTQNSIEDFKVHSFIDYNDLWEMTNCLEKMQDSNYSKVYKTLNQEEINAYRTTFSYYSSYLKMYPQLQTVSNIIAELSVILSLYSENCLLQGKDFRTLLESFVNNVFYWQDKLFHKGGAALHFMDESFQADLSQIKMVLNLYDGDTEESHYNTVEDIFNF